MLEAFVVGGIGFWGLILAEIILLLIFTELEYGVAATISVVVFGLTLQLVSKVNLLQMIWLNPILAAPIAGAYVLLGIAWGIYMWRKYYRKKISIYDEAFEGFLVKNNLSKETKVLPEEFRKEWTRVVKSTEKHDDYLGKYVTIADIPQAKDHKSKIARWMCLWMFSFMLFLCKDMVIEFWNNVYNCLGRYLQHMVDREYSKRNIKENLDVSNLK